MLPKRLRYPRRLVLLRTRPVVMTTDGTPRKRHVLILDDDIALAWPLKETLESRGYDATIVPEGTLALRFVSQHTLDAVVCDLQVLRLEGDLLHAAIERSNPSLAQRFIFITGEENVSRVEQFADSARLPVFHKPVGIESLVGEVVRVAEQAS
ncbi:MAG TPA: response regulator [Candidatus Angelobacter sp.]|nr:response regulator [Candidatus Angelobacter sp.]